MKTRRRRTRERGDGGGRSGASLVVVGVIAAIVGGGCGGCGKRGADANADANANANADANANASASASASGESGSSGSAEVWVRAAERAPVLGERARKARLGIGTKASKLALIDALLEKVAKLPETADGIREGARELEQHQDYGADHTWAGSGTSPGATLMHHGGVALLVDLTARACASKKGDAQIGKAADEVPLPPWFNSGGIDRQTAERDRHVLQEAARACGAKVDP